MQPKLKWLALISILALLLVLTASVTFAAPDADADGDGITNAIEIATNTDPNKADTDGDGLCDGNLDVPPFCVLGEDMDVDGVVDAHESDPRNIDTDGDGLEDGPIDIDWDHPGWFDGLTETTYGTAAWNADSDGDTIPDGWEAVFGVKGPAQVPVWLMAMYNLPWPANTLPWTAAGCDATDPTDATDALLDNDPLVLPAPFPFGQDGLNNVQEFQYKTNPCVSDTDLDGAEDGNEALGTNGVKSNPNDPDTDKDGLCDGAERNTGQFIKKMPYPVANFPYSPLTDKRLLNPDGIGFLLPPQGVGNCTNQINAVIAWGDFGSSPANADSDGDTIPDGREVTGALNDWNGKPFVPAGPPGWISNPNKQGGFADTDGDGVDDGVELNFCGSGLSCLTMDPANPDSDGDLMDDKYEHDRLSCGAKGGLDPTDPADAAKDQDGDTLLNLYEYQKGMNPCSVDSDGDGINDFWEDYYREGGGQGGTVICPVSPANKITGMDPLVNDAAGDIDGDWASNMQEYLGVDGVAPPLALPLDNQLKDSTVPCNVDTDGDLFDDGYEYVKYNSSKYCTGVSVPAAATDNRFNPAPVARGGKDDSGGDYDNDSLLNTEEYQGPNGKPDGGVAGPPIPPGQFGWVDDRYLDACDPDSDNGGALDGWEWMAKAPYKYDPNNSADDLQDQDLDGIPTATEDRGDLPQAVNSVWWVFDGMAHETDFADPDTDDDNLCDGNLVVPNAAYPAAIITGANPPLVIVTNNELWLDTVPMTFVCKLGEDKNNPFRTIAGDDGDRNWEAGELWTETDPRDADTDDDGLNDGAEVITVGTNPLDADTDDDQLDDNLEAMVSDYKWNSASSACTVTVGGVVHTSPLNPDSDGDGLYDGFKGGSGVQLGTTVAPIRGFIVNTGPGWLGFDGPDTILGNANDQPGEDFVKTFGTWQPAATKQETNPCLVDTDFDGVGDGIEYTKFESPLYKSSGQLNWNTPAALIADTNIDSDSIRPALDHDSDGDSLCDGDVKNPANQAPAGFPANPPQAGCPAAPGPDGKWDTADDLNGDINQLIGEDLNGDGVQGVDETKVMNGDSDGDAVWDGVEVTWYETFDCGTRTYRTDLLAWNCDGDANGRDALDADSDNDGLLDGFVDTNGNGLRDPNEGEDLLAVGLAPWAFVDAPFNGMIRGDLWVNVPPPPPASAAYNRVWSCGADLLCGTADDKETFLETDPLNLDTDGDGLSDGYERAQGFDPLSAVGDFDNDGLSDGDEVAGKTCGKPTNPKDADSDDDGWKDGEECKGEAIPAPYPGGGGGQQKYQKCDPLNVDTDGDGLTDWEEGRLNGDGFVLPALDLKWGGPGDGFVTDCSKKDTDSGGITDDIEYILIVFWKLGYNPQNALDDAWDSDHDGLSDGEEVMLAAQWACLSPIRWDSDNDLLNDHDELFGTFASGAPWHNPPANPCNPDTDGDLLQDGTEKTMDTDPTLADTDGDGLTDGIEVYLWQSKPKVRDTDGDGLVDGWVDANGNGKVDPCEGEDLNLNGALDAGETNPTKTSTNGVYPDGWYCLYSGCLGATNNAPGDDKDGDGLTNAQEAQYNTNPCSDDTDNDGLKDKWEVTYMACAALDPVATNNAAGDLDADGLTNLQEQAAGTSPCDSDSDDDTLKDGVDPWPLSPDGDKDGMPDAWEVLFPCLDPKVNDANGNPDGDAYTNIQEYQMGSDPCVFNCELMYDWDQDGEVTVADVLMMVGSWQATPGDPNWVPAYDVDNDGEITVIDFMIVVNHIGDHCP